MNRNPECKLCELHEQCKTVCIPTIRYPPCPTGDLSQNMTAAAQKSIAVLVLGEAPGGQEDAAGEPFVGPSGKMLKECYIDHFGLTEVADVYLGNAVRCRPPLNDKPKKKHIKACSVYLKRDLDLLRERYEQVYVLCVGASAAEAMGFRSLKQALSNQGKEL